MVPQSEYSLEEFLVNQLVTQGFAPVHIQNEKEMLVNLREQLGKHNGNIVFSDEEFNKILAYLNTGGAFERAKRLRDKFALRRDNNEVVYIEFFNSVEWCKNQMQVAHQVGMEGKRKNRYDVTLLFNGLPLVQIELKKRGTELKVAFNQIQRYHHESYDAGYGLFQYVQIFIISNGVNTRYFANNKSLSYQFTFSWADQNNRRINDLSEFSAIFLQPCHISKMISHYTIVNETEKFLMIMRPYQVYAAEAIIDRVKNSDRNGYIWHTTGSGKTLTAFKASQILVGMPKVHKVLFVVDRKDLDYQTAREFNSFVKDSVDMTTDTKELVKQLIDPKVKLIVTTIQKLNVAITKDRHLAKINHLQDEKFVLIFDECHRSQFGETHTNIKQFFGNSQLFGFTGTPIFDDNSISKGGVKQTTVNLFDECLHKYIIVDAIRDGNVLPFSVEYVASYPVSLVADDGSEISAQDKRIFEHPKRLEKIVDYILKHHKQKTRYPDFTAMFCVNSIETLIEYYRLFKEKQADSAKPLKIATIFSYSANPELATAEEEQKGFIEDEEIGVAFSGKIDQSQRDKLDEYIGEYNKTFGTAHSTVDSKAFYNYYNDIAARVKKREIDILLVVNMFLTGFDSPCLNTIYVDKNLCFHGLIQAFSRTNRLVDDRKSHGNIVCFRDLKEATDEAITLFSNKNPKEDVLVEPYVDYVEKFNDAVESLREITPTVQSVDDLLGEHAEKEFIKNFRELLRLKNVLATFADYDAADLNFEEQEFADYISKYFDLFDKHKRRKDENSEDNTILDEIDFGLELAHRDEINVEYILGLLAKLAKIEGVEQFEKLKKEIVNLLAGEVQLRGKRKLITNFMEKHLLLIPDEVDVKAAFYEYINEEKEKAFFALCSEERLEQAAVAELLKHYLFSGRLPRQEEIIKSLISPISILKRESTYRRIDQKIREFIEIYIDGLG